MKKHCEPAWCSAREGCVVVVLRLRRRNCVSKRRVVTNVAFIVTLLIAMKPNGHKNDVCCEYTRGALEPLLLQFPIDTVYNPTNRDYFCACGT